MRLWNLPGARRFIDDVCNYLRRGSNVVVRFPGAIPRGFDAAIAADLGNAFEIGSMSATPTPFDDLRRRFADQPDQVRTLADLCDDRGFRGRLIRLRGIEISNWSAWRDFLSRYAQSSRSCSLLGRTLFLVPLASDPPATPPDPDVALEVRAWDSVLDDIDLLLLATEHLRERAASPLRRTLLANVVARVASWDFDTASALLAESDSVMLAPTELLRVIGEGRGWSRATPVEWRLGTASRSGIAHPARAALEDPPVEIHRRLWSAQMSVLLPWIEEIRHATIASNVYEVKRQMRDARKSHADPYALELGELHSLFSRRGADKAMRRNVPSATTGTKPARPPEPPRARGRIQAHRYPTVAHVGPTGESYARLLRPIAI